MIELSLLRRKVNNTRIFNKSSAQATESEKVLYLHSEIIAKKEACCSIALTLLNKMFLLAVCPELLTSS